MVERYSRCILIVRTDNKIAEAVSFGFLSHLAFICYRVETLTYDNGKEFAKHFFTDDISRVSRLIRASLIILGTRTP